MARSQIQIQVRGMTCTHCKQAVEKALRQQVPGVLSVAVDLASGTAAIEYDATAFRLESVADAVEAAGFEAVLPG